MSEQLEEYILNAKYRCWKCKHEWTQQAAIVTCPKCSHVFVTWLNHPLTIEQEKVNKEPSFWESVKIIDKALENG